MRFEWDHQKNLSNIEKHGVSFDIARQAFFDRHRKIQLDVQHSTKSEKRYFCYGRVDGHVLTVRFTFRKGLIRIFGAGYWRSGKKKYESKKRKLKRRI
jgi:uncharacterized DUF497 family protein